jgi:TonB family protein
MKYVRSALRYAFFLAIFAIPGCGRKANAQIVGEPHVSQASPLPSVSGVVQQPSLSPSPTPAAQTKPASSPAVDLSRLETNVRPAVIWVTFFDPSGKLLRTQTGFFISSDGRFVATAQVIEGAVNGVAKTADGGIYNVNGALVDATTLDLAVLQADVKHVPFLALNKNAHLSVGTHVGVVGSGLAGAEGAPRDVAIATHESYRVGIAAVISPGSIGSPIIDANGQVAGVVISAGEKPNVRPADALDLLLSQIPPDAKPHWPQAPEASATARPTPKPHIVYAPAPSFPSEGRVRPGEPRSGRFRLSFDTKGKVRNIQIIHSTGDALLDQAAISGLRQWKSTPGVEWSAAVPVTFQTR